MKFFSLFSTASRTALGPTQPPIQWVPGALSLGVKRPGREADHSPPPGTEVKNVLRYSSTHNCVIMTRYLVKHRDNFIRCHTFFTSQFLFFSFIFLSAPVSLLSTFFPSFYGPTLFTQGQHTPSGIRTCHPSYQAAFNRSMAAYCDYSFLSSSIQFPQYVRPLPLHSLSLICR